MNFRAVLGKISLVLMLWIVLVVGPIAVIRFNDAWSWPRLDIPAGRATGGGLMVGALVVWLHCSRLFSRVGRGTPFVTDPPTKLVIAGLYRYSRNPIYVAHVAFLLGWFLRSGRLSVLLYTGLMIGLIQAAVVWWEEPGLRERFGEDYTRYTQKVPRWIFIRARLNG